TRAIESSTSPDTFSARPCSIHVYQETPTPASSATSSRRSPGVRRLPASGSPTWLGDTLARRAMRNRPSSRRCGGATRLVEAVFPIGCGPLLLMAEPGDVRTHAAPPCRPDSKTNILSCLFRLEPPLSRQHGRGV